MKFIFSRVVAVFVAISMLSLGAFAYSETDRTSLQVVTNQNTDNKIWQINIDARILKVDPDAVWVYIETPNSMKINKNDQVQSIQRLPRTKNTLACDSDNNVLSIDQIVPSQKIKVKFTYRFVGSARLAMPIECISVVIQDTFLKANSTKKISDLKVNHMIASVVDIDGSKMTVFIEGGRLLNGDTSYDVTGRAVVNVADASVKNANGKKIQLNALNKYDRVVMSTKNSVWNETEPPTYDSGDAVTIQVLESGESVIHQGSVEISQIESEKVDLYIFLAEFILNENRKLEFIAIEMDETALNADEKKVFSDKLAKQFETKILFGDHKFLKDLGLISSEFPYALKNGILITYDKIEKKKMGLSSLQLNNMQAGKVAIATVMQLL